MSNFEIGFCSRGEYIRTENDRIKEADLTLGGLYTVMFELARLPSATENDRQKAARYPSRITRATQVETDSWKLAFTICNVDLVPDFKTQGTTSDGYLLSVPARNLNIGGHYGVVAGYFKAYSNGHDGEQELQDIITGQTPGQSVEIYRPARVPTKVY